MNSKEKLAQAIEEHRIGYIVLSDDNDKHKTSWQEKLASLDTMIQRAKEGYYSDYDSPLALPCVQLVKDLTASGLTELAERAKQGEFDATEEESDEWYEREGRQLALEVGGGSEEIADALFGKTKEQKASRDGIFKQCLNNKEK